MTPALLLAPLVAQAAVMLADEGWFHRRRGLPRWERIGHPVDTLSVAVAYAWLVATAPTRENLAVYIALAVVSCVVVTKDEWVHARVCTPGEHWLHAVLFVLHPVAFGAVGALWWTGGHGAIVGGQLLLTIAFGIYQLVYWRLR